MDASRLHKAQVFFAKRSLECQVSNAMTPCARSEYHGRHPRTARQATATPRLRRRAQPHDGYRVQESRRHRRRRHLSELCERLFGLESAGAAHRRQCTDAVFHRASASAARTRKPWCTKPWRTKPWRTALRQSMRVWRYLGQQRWAKVTIGVVTAEYLRFVGA